jgi:hypothetical protein
MTVDVNGVSKTKKSRLLKRGYDGRHPEAGAVCADCGVPSPMQHRIDCPKKGVKKSGFDSPW